MDLNCDKLTFYNMTIFYRTELKKILNDSAYSSSVLDNLVRIKLSKLGILVHVGFKSKYINADKRKHARQLYPSCLAMMILEGLFDEYDFME